ncbi:hypothetical protein FQZ97_941960 [compost metagenome]
MLQRAARRKQIGRPAAGLIAHALASDDATRQDEYSRLVPARPAGGGDGLSGPLLQQVFHEGAALAQVNHHTQGEQTAPGILATAAEHFHGHYPFLRAALRYQAQ